MTIKTVDEFRALARQIIRDTPDPDPAAAAEKILDQLSATECRTALKLTLADWVRTYRGTLDRAARSRSVRVEPGERDPLTNKPVGSSKVRRIRDWYRDVCATTVFNGVEWKLLGECTPVDVSGAAESRYKAADATRTEGDKFAGIAAWMVEHQTPTVAKIPPRVLQDLLQGGA